MRSNVRDVLPQKSGTKQGPMTSIKKTLKPSRALPSFLSTLPPSKSTYEYFFTPSLIMG